MSTPGLITIDGPVASGKTTVGRALAEHLGFRFVDTGLMYRAVTALALRAGIPTDDTVAMGDLAERTELTIEISKAGTRVLMDGADITGELYSPEVGREVSVVSAAAQVRAALVAQQRRMAAQGGTVMVGRDIGTVVLPDAPLKVFLLASPEERTRRRHREVTAGGSSATEDAVREELELRDALDSGRELAPLRPADDALQIDTSGLSVNEVVERVIALAREK